MKLLFDLTATQADKNINNHGGSEYAKAVFFKLIEYQANDVTVFYDKSRPLEDTIVNIIHEYSLQCLENADIKSICDFIINQRINVFYSALPSHKFNPIYKLQSDNFKVIITIHGLRYLEFPRDKFELKYITNFKQRIKYYFKRLFPYQYKNNLIKSYSNQLNAHSIITVSNHSKYSLLTFFPSLSPEKISVFYSPLIDYKNYPVSSAKILEKLSLSAHKYLLVLSGSIWIKNSYRAVKAFDELVSDHPNCKNYKMIVTGMKNLHFKVMNPGNFEFTDYLKREELEELLKNANALVYPTLNEGFGYPPLEALKYGVSVLASGINPITEICGDVINYFNPNSINDIKINLLSALSETGLKNTVLIQKRIERYSLIKKRQEQDLDMMIKRICGSDKLPENFHDSQNPYQ